MEKRERDMMTAEAEQGGAWRLESYEEVRGLVDIQVGIYLDEILKIVGE